MRTLAAGVCVVALMAACTSPDASPGLPAVRELSGQMLPDLEGPTMGGGSISPVAYAGRPVVVNFWATWCDPCERELPMLVQAHRDGVAFFVGIDYKDTASEARRWIREYAIGYPNLADPDGALASRFGVTLGLPTTFVADADGMLRYQVMGELDRETLDDLLDGVSG
jgi:cytochrome c biogenesis protein CcmG/thiol:disulfide interchange protein DsbE